MPQAEKSPAIKKGWLRALLILLPFLFISGIFQAIGAYIWALSTGQHPLEVIVGSSSNGTIGFLLIQFFATIGTLLTVWIFMRSIDKKRMIELGLSFKNQSKNTIGGILAGFLLMSAGTLILIGTGNLTIESVTPDFVNLISSILLFALVAVNEEVLVRGYILRNMMESMNRYLALILSSLLFVVLHLLNPNISAIGLVNLFLAGLLLGISYIFTRNLWFPIALHFSWNFFQGPIFGFEVSGTTSYSLITQNLQGSELLTGGQFGLEGSVLATILCSITLFICWYYYKKQDIVLSSIK